MRKFVLLSLTLVALFVGFVKCRKENRDNSIDEKPDKQKIIQESKSWYEKHCNFPDKDARQRSAVLGNSSPDWNSAEVYFDDTFEAAITVVPTYIDNHTGVVKQQIFVSSLDGINQIVISRIIEAVPQPSYNSAYAFSTRCTNFTGTINVYTENGVFVSSSGYNNGRSSSNARVSQRSALSSTPLTKGIEGILLDEVVIEAPDESHHASGNFMVYVTARDFILPYVQGIPLYPPSWGGGGVGPSPNEVDTVKNLVITPCVRTLVNALMNAQLKNKISTTVNKIFGGSSNVNVVFRERPAADFAAGQLGRINYQETYFNGPPNKPFVAGQVMLELNVDSLKHASQELISTVILHEAIHGFLAWRGFERVISHHETMAEAYRDAITNALGELYPNMPLGDRQALSWAGLIETYQWKLTEVRAMQDQNVNIRAILQLVIDHQDGVKGTASGCP